MRGGAGLGAGLMADLRYALRQLRTAPGFAVTAVVTLALTVGLAAVVFSVFDAVLVRPLPYGHVSRLMEVETWAPEGYTQPASWNEYKFWRDNGAKVLDIAGYEPTTTNLRAGTTALPAHVLGVTANFFKVMDTGAALGRILLPTEGEHGNTSVAVLSYAMWQREFAGRAGVIGEKIELDGVPLTVVGVTPAGFRYSLSEPEQVYVPLFALPNLAAWMKSPDTHWLESVARLRPGVTREQAQAAMNGVVAAYARVHPDDASLGRRRMRLTPISQALLGQTGQMVLALGLAVLAVLLLGCVNVAGMMLARGLRRGREFALRAALGASRWTLARQLFVELLVLAVAGTVAGCVFAEGLLVATRRLLVAALAQGGDIHLNVLVFAAALLAAMGTLSLAGLLPLRQIQVVSPAAALRSGSQSAGNTRRSNRLRGLFLAAQVALAMLLLTASALLLVSLHGAEATNVGFRLDHLLLEEVALTQGTTAAEHPDTGFYGPLLAKLQGVPGVAAAGVITMAPLQNSGMNFETSVVGQPVPSQRSTTLAEIRFVSPGYYQVMGQRLVQGRLPDDALDHAGVNTVVVNQAFVRRFLPAGVDPIGRTITNWNGNRIVGVVSDVRQSLMMPAMPECDFPISALAAADAAPVLRDAEIMLRTTVPPAQLREPLRKAMASVDPSVPFRPAMTMDDVLREVLTLELLENWLFGAFGVLALVLALVGLYGLVAQEVEQGRRATGIRMALGAERGRVLRAVLGRVALTAGCGVAVGAALSYAAHQVIGTLLPVEVTHSVLVAVTVACVMELLAVWAAFGPARRAASVDPVEVLRAE